MTKDFCLLNIVRRLGIPAQQGLYKKKFVILSKANEKNFSLKQAAFTLAEMMVVMLIVSIVLAAMAPVMTTKMKRDMAANDGSGTGPASSIWKWIDDNTAIYFSTGGNEPVMIGQKEFGADDPSALLILNADDASRNQILFKSRDSVLGRLSFNNNSVLLGHVGTASIGANSVAIGYNALSTNTADNNTAIGNAALQNNETCNDNIAIGYAVLSNLSNGNANIAVGRGASGSLMDGEYNIAIGMGALSALKKGKNNVAIGVNACKSLTEGINNVCIGKDADVPNENTSNLIVLGNSQDVYIPRSVDIGGTLKVSGTVVKSDQRLKYVGKESKDGLDKIRQLKVFNYTFKKDEKKTPRVGVIAQDLQKVFPNAVKKGSDGFLTIRMEDMFYALVNAVKELDNRVTEILKRVQDDRKEIQALKKENKILKEQNKALDTRLKALEAKIK